MLVGGIGPVSLPGGFDLICCDFAVLRGQGERLVARGLDSPCLMAVDMSGAGAQRTLVGRRAAAMTMALAWVPPTRK